MRPEPAGRVAARKPGLTQVFDYVAGKMDWFASGLSIEGRSAGPRVGDLARAVPTCGLADSVGEVRSRLARADQNACIVVDDRGVVLGRLVGDALRGDPSAPAEAVMRPGPSTFRPHVSLQEMLDYMQRHEMDSALITTSDGRLVGSVSRGDIEETIRQSAPEKARAAR